MRRFQLFRGNQDGFAAIVVALVLVLVLSLITVGFATLMRGEQRSALDKQLQDQANYAAESGINAAAAAINAGFESIKTQCGPYTPSDISGLVDSNPNATSQSIANSSAAAQKYLSSDQVGGSGSNVSYPCLLIDPYPNKLQYNSISTTAPRTVEITAQSNNGVADSVIRSLVISWKSQYGDNNTYASSTPSNPAANGAFTSINSWPYLGILRIALTNGTNLDRQKLAARTMTAFLYPSKDGLNNPLDYTQYNSQNSTQYADANSGYVAGGNCQPGGQEAGPPGLPKQQVLDCYVVITGLDALTYYLEMRSIYSPVSVQVQAYNSTGLVNMKNAQTVVDSTGLAQDVLKRLQVRISSQPVYSISSGPTGTGGNGANASICKNFGGQLFPGSSATPCN